MGPKVRSLTNDSKGQVCVPEFLFSATGGEENKALVC